MANTGRIEYEEVDQNPYSPTYGQTRWVDGGVSLSACPLPVTYRSAAISEFVQKADCAEGQFGSQVDYTLAYGTYTSGVSQLDADTQARTYFDSTKQAYANANGTCSATDPSQWIPVYKSSGCFACKMQNKNDATDTRNATDQEVADYYVSNSISGGPCAECV